jgi:hypothetical protein
LSYTCFSFRYTSGSAVVSGTLDAGLSVLGYYIEQGGYVILDSFFRSMFTISENNTSDIPSFLIPLKNVIPYFSKDILTPT